MSPKRVKGCERYNGVSWRELFFVSLNIHSYLARS